MAATRSKVQVAAADIDKAMRELRRTMRGIQIRRAGFKRNHDNLARAVAKLTVTLVDAAPLTSGKRRKGKR